MQIHFEFGQIQCPQSSLAQDGGANHRQHCIRDLQKALKTLIKRSQQLPEMFEIALRPIWWAAGSNQRFEGFLKIWDAMLSVICSSVLGQTRLQTLYIIDQHGEKLGFISK